MAQYINKDALVAEIERLREIQPLDFFRPKESNKIDWLAGKLFTITSLEVFLDTLEVKEVDLEKIIEQTYHDRSITDTVDMDHITYENIAKYFFELGLKHKKRE